VSVFDNSRFFMLMFTFLIDSYKRLQKLQHVTTYNSYNMLQPIIVQKGYNITSVESSVLLTGLIIENLIKQGTKQIVISITLCVLESVNINIDLESIYMPTSCLKATTFCCRQFCL